MMLRRKLGMAASVVISAALIAGMVLLIIAVMINGIGYA